MANTKKADREGLIIFLSILLLSILLIIRLIGLYLSEGLINTNYRDPEIGTTYFRGTLYDRSGNILAMDRTTYMIKINSKRVSEVGRTASLLAPYTDIDAVNLENMIRASEHLELPSNLMLSEIERFNQMLKRENLDHLVTLEAERERIYPLGEHGRLIIGRENEDSSFSAESLFDSYLEPALSLDGGLSHGSDITLSISQRIEYAADHIVNSYVPDPEKGFLMLAMLNYSTGEIYALSVSSGKEEDIDFSLIEKALDGRDYTILKSKKEIELTPPEDITLHEEYFSKIIYRSGYAIIAESESEKTMNSALMEFEAMLSL